MKKQFLNVKLLTWLFVVIIMSSCKSEWLDIRSDKKLVVPSSLKDLQAVMDSPRLLTTGVPSMGELSADNYVLTSDGFNGLRDSWQKNVYVWAEDIYEDGSLRGVHQDWTSSYEKVYHANLVLEGIDKLKDLSQSDKDMRDQIRGQALFIRAWAYFHLSQLFSPHYDKKTADSKLSIPLRLSSDINEKLVQVTVARLYGQMISDLESASELLPIHTNLIIRPVKAAAEGLLAKIYLVLGDFEAALHYADRSLQRNDKLLDFNDLNPNMNYPIIRDNIEVVHRSSQNSFATIGNVYEVNPELYNLYEHGDLRKTILFKENNGKIRFHGSYEGSNVFFGGISVNELILIRAESHVRLNNNQKALGDLKNLLKNRYESDAFNQIQFNGDLLDIILLERRKELPFRGVRWSDLRRLNAEGKHLVTLKREVNGEIFLLKPNDLKYTLPFPDMVVKLNDLVQNER